MNSCEILALTVLVEIILGFVWMDTRTEREVIASLHRERADLAARGTRKGPRR